MSSDDGDAVTLSALARVAQDKAPRTVIVRTEADKAALRAAIETSMTTGLVGRAAQRFRADDDMVAKALESGSKVKVQRALRANAAHRASLQEIEIRSVEADNALARLDPATTKLYVVGHGVAGTGAMQFKQSEGPPRKLDFRHLAHELRALGLPLSYQDVRLDVCYGIDVPQPTGTARLPTAQRFANAMGQAGFKGVRITAYPERFKMAPQLFADGQLHRAVELHSRDPHETYRASAVSQGFVPQHPAGASVGNAGPAIAGPDASDGVDEPRRGTPM